jgi:hypothetical protein
VAGHLQSFDSLLAGLLCLACVVQAGCSDSPTAPTTDTTSPGTASARPIVGAVTDAIRGVALPGVNVTIEQGGSATTDGSGQFAVQAPAVRGSYRATLSGPSVITRQTTVSLPATSLTVTLIPSSFDMASFEEFARDFGNGVIIRWSSPPALVVETSLVGLPSNQNVALAEQTPASEIDRLIDRLSQALPRLTGSTFTQFASVRRQTTASGNPISMYTSGAITVVYYTENNGACGQGGPGIVQQTAITGAVWLKADCASLSVNSTAAVHELGHALGYGHVSGVPSVMRATGGIDITSFDLAAAGIVFRRPPGNRAPDTDPDSFRVNASASRTPGEGVTILAPLP